MTPDPAPTDPAAAAAAPSRPRSARRALVVENDLASRELLARVLRNKGLRADTAIGAAQAAAILLDAGGAIDLLIVDLDLNRDGIDGVDLLRRLAQLPPAARPARVVAIAASLADAHPRLADLGMPVETFQKPVHLPGLMRIVEDVVARG